MENVINSIHKERIIAIVRGVAVTDLIPFAEAAYKGGIRLLELTYNASAPEADEQNAEAIRMLCEHFSGEMLIGAGTVLTPHQAELTAQAGGKFIISPNTDETVIRKTVEMGLVSIPGALTPSEIVAAYHYGAHFVKVFPAENLGCNYIKAVTAPLSHIPLLAVGGVNPQNIPDFLKAGVKGFGIGSAIVNRGWIAEGRFDEITESAKKFTEAAKR